MPTQGVTFLRKRDTAANWTANDPVLPEGEKGIETDTLLEKLGDGVTAWTSLSYLPGTGGTTKGTGTEAAGAVTINAVAVCVITTAGTAISSGSVFTVTLTSDQIGASSGFVGNVANGTNSQGLPVIQSITRSGGTAIIKILNVAGQTDSNDTNGTLKLTIFIL